MSTPRPFSSEHAITGIADIFDQDELRELPLELVDPDPEQPRQTWDTPDAIENFNNLVESIRSEGVRDPIAVRTHSNGRFVIIYGESRWRASREAGRNTIPAVVRQKISDRQVRIDQLAENLRRNDLNPVDLARGLERAIEGGISRDDLMQALGCKEAWLSKRLSILKFGQDVQDLARAGRVRDIDTLSALNQMGPEDRAAQLRALEEGSFDGAAARATLSKKRKKKRKATSSDPNIKSLLSQMQDFFGTKVRLEHNPKTGKGSVTFAFFSLDELDGLLQKWQFRHKNSIGE